MEQYINHINSMKLTQNYGESFFQGSQMDFKKIDHRICPSAIHPLSFCDPLFLLAILLPFVLGFHF